MGKRSIFSDLGPHCFEEEKQAFDPFDSTEELKRKRKEMSQKKWREKICICADRILALEKQSVIVKKFVQLLKLLVQYGDERLSLKDEQKIILELQGLSPIVCVNVLKNFAHLAKQTVRLQEANESLRSRNFDLRRRRR